VRYDCILCDALDAVIVGVNLVEDDSNDDSVGYSGLPSEAEQQLVMEQNRSRHAGWRRSAIRQGVGFPEVNLLTERSRIVRAQVEKGVSKIADT
jgi:hypothetical protein